MSQILLNMGGEAGEVIVLPMVCRGQKAPASWKRTPDFTRRLFGVLKPNHGSAH